MSAELIVWLVLVIGFFILLIWLVLTLRSSLRRIDNVLSKLAQRGGFPNLRRTRKEGAMERATRSLRDNAEPPPNEAKTKGFRA